MKYLSTALLCLLFANFISAQEVQKDTVNKLLPVVIVVKQQSPERMPKTKDNILFSGKKNEVLRLSNLNANLTNNNAREVFARIPGVTRRVRITNQRWS